MLAQRRRLLTLAVPALVVVLIVGFFVARWLTTENRERDAIFTLLEREAAGDDQGVVRRLHDCDATCQAKLRAFLPRVKGAGSVKIARLDSGTAYTFGTKTGTTRVVWVHGVEARPIVQCVVVQRHGGPLTGRSVSLLRVSAPLADNEGSC
ncbi:MAG TPA: hypothetical protein VFG42_27310 [Baekduia sp.]|uniref:hypothetical protein n=1 Tax=Baekduia sp. TaxID=2600305 RepID=UPI002D78EC6A|nr:hypothetical protein [Baekduia sp.]HET6510535.1 hypothetical protein [Baekduia sp.]